MNTVIARTVALLLLVGAIDLRAQVPQLINYQGRVAVGGVNFDGSGQFKFALVNAAGTTTYWSNDGTSTIGSQPTAAVTLAVTKGLYSLLLGDATLANMTAIPNSVFDNSDVRLRVWFNDGTNGSQLLTPDQRMAAVGYAFVAGTLQPGAALSLSSATVSGNVGIGTTTPVTPLEVNGTVTATRFRWAVFSEITPDQGGSVELGNSMGSGTIPYIDFHYGVGFEQDHNVRLVNNADGQLTVEGGFRATGTVTADRFIATAHESPANVIPVLGMVWIKPGTFIMGSRADEPGRSPDEGPQAVVTLTKGFWMGVHEVTQAEYQTVTGSNPSFFTGDTNRPVESVSWNDAVAYCAALTTAERTAGRLPAGWGYRLPTEAQWEYACRAGARTTRFGYGDDLNGAALANYAWYSVNSGNTTHPVEQKLANPWGLMDMHGNVWEWCQDFYGSYPGGSVSDPTGPESGSYRVIRGGSLYGSATDCRSAQRIISHPDDALNIIGCRVVLAPSQP